MAAAMEAGLLVAMMTRSQKSEPEGEWDDWECSYCALALLIIVRSVHGNHRQSTNINLFTGTGTGTETAR